MRGDATDVTTISDDERRRRIGVRHLLAAADLVEKVSTITDSLVALHSSDPVTVYLSLAARSAGLSVNDVERALYDERSVVRHHAMRRTLWVMTPEVASLAHAACTRKIAAAERKRTARIAGDPAWLDDAIDDVVALVRSAEEPVTTRAIGERAPHLRRSLEFGAGTKNAVELSAHTRAPLVAAFDGSIMRGPSLGSWVASQYAWVDATSWVTIDWEQHDELGGATGLVGRWLDRFGPGTLDDIVWWTGATKSLVRRALEALEDVEVELSTGTGFVLPDDIDESPDIDPWAALLPGLDPTSMGWRHRAWYLDDETTPRVTDRNGNIGPTVWVDGRVVGGWAQRPDGTIATELTVDVDDHERALIDERIDRIRLGVQGTGR